MDSTSRLGVRVRNTVRVKESLVNDPIILLALHLKPFEALAETDQHAHALMYFVGMLFTVIVGSFK